MCSAAGCRMQSEDVGTWSWWWCSLLCASGIKGRHCWNEKQMLVRNSPDCSSFSFFSCLSFERCLTLSPSLLPPLTLLCIYLPSSSLLFIMLWHILYLKLFLNQRGNSLLQQVCSSVSKQRNFFWGFTIQQLDLKTLHPSDVIEQGKNEKERGMLVTEALSFCIPVWDLVSCLTLRFATLTESLFQAERQEEAHLAALCACVALDGLWCCITLCTAVKRGWKAAVISLSSIFFPHTVFTVQSV